MPYPITGTDPANMEARMGGAFAASEVVAGGPVSPRLGSTRLGYHNPKVRITIAGTDVSSLVRQRSLIVGMDLTAPGTATFTKFDGTAPSVGQQVIVGTGSITNRIFGGHIIRVTTRAFSEKISANTAEWLVECQDWTWMLNRTLAYGSFTGTVSSILASLLDSFTDGTFTLAYADSALGSITEFTVDFEPVGDAILRLLGLAGGALWIDPWKGLHAIVTTDVWQRPHALSSAFTDYKDLSYTQDLSQIKTSVYAFSALPLTVTGGSPCSGDTITKVAVETDVDVYSAGSTTIFSVWFPRTREVYTFERIGVPEAIGGVGTTVIAAASAGATQIQVNNIALFESGGVDGGWARVGGSQVVRYHTRSAASGAAFIQGIPASGEGALLADVAVGSTAQVEPYVQLVSGSLTTAVRATDDLVLYTVIDDAAAATAIAALEGGDGVHVDITEPVQSRTAAALTSAAQARLDKYNDTVAVLRYSTFDPCSMVGRSVAVSLASPLSLSDTLRILRVTITNFELGQWKQPTRAVEASTTQTSLFDLFGRVFRTSSVS